MEGRGLISLVCLVALFVAGAYSLGMQSNLQNVEWVLRTNGNWTINRNWAPPAEPSTIDDALLYTSPPVSVGLSQNRVIRSLNIANGYEIVISDGAILAVNAPALARPGFFISAVTGIETACPAFSVQPLRNQAYCTDCNQFGQIANGGQSQCIFCPAGKIFSATAASRCTNCPPYQDSDGLGGVCKDCPAGFSSVGGVPCTICPAPKDSRSGGPCLVCLPTERDYTCGCTAATGVCVSTIEGAIITDPVTGRTRNSCACNSGFDGPSCTAFNPEVRVSPIAKPTSVSLVFRHNNIADTLTIVPQPLFETNAGTNTGDLYTWTSHAWTTNSTLITTGRASIPTGYTATPITFQLDMWYKKSGVVIPLQELKVPLRVNIPWDRLTTSTPWRLELFFYNTNTKKWEQAIRNCVGEPNTKREVLAQDPNQAKFGTKTVNADGTISWDIYQTSATFGVFLAGPNITNIPGTAVARLNSNAAVAVNNVNLGNNTQIGNARVPEITTGLSGVLPLPPRVDPGNAPGEPTRRPIENFPSTTSSSASVLAVSNAAMVLVASLVYLLF